MLSLAIDRNRRYAPFRRSTRLFIQQTLARDSVFVIVLGVRCIKKLLGRTETRTRERKCFRSIRTVWDISRDDRARILTCSLRTATDLRRIIYTKNVLKNTSVTSHVTNQGWWQLCNFLLFCRQLTSVDIFLDLQLWGSLFPLPWAR